MHNTIHGRAAARQAALTAALAAIGAGAGAASFSAGPITGSFDSTVSVGAGIRTTAPDAALVSPTYDPASFAPTGGGRLGQVGGLSDQGDINYKKGDAFTTYLKGSHELLLKMPSEGLALMARGTWIRDVGATRTSGMVSGQDLLAAPAIRDGLADEARDELRFKARLLDLWVSKTFELGGKQVRARAGNQVISWGENIYEPGGVNATNALDVNRASQPGAQVKEFVLPAPILSVAAGLGGGVDVEAYVQGRWNKSDLPPVGSYWSSSVVGPGSAAYGARTVDARNGGQWGLALRYQPAGTELNLGFYAMAYHDKLPQTSLDPAGATTYRYLEDRRMLGASANFPLGDWAVGTELSYRPRDAVSLNPASGCVAQGGNCWVDARKWQWHLTSLLSLQPSNAHALLALLGAQSATLTTETVVVAYPGLRRDYGGAPVAAGGSLWGNEFNDVVVSGALNTPGAAAGSKYSGGVDLDFNWVYDGSLVPGWQVNPGIYLRRALFGRTPNVGAQFMRGAGSVNLYVNFVQNPANWQVGLNYTRFSGAGSPLDTPLRDRDFVGVVASRNF